MNGFDEHELKLVIEYIKRLERTLGDLPSAAQIAFALRMTVGKVAAILEYIGSDVPNEGSSAFKSNLSEQSSLPHQMFGRITPQEWEQVQQERCRTGEPISVILIKLGLATENHIKNALELQYGVNYVSLARIAREPAVTDMLPLSMQRRLQVIPISVDGKRITIAMVNPNDIDAINDVRKELAGFEVRVVVCTGEDADHFLNAR